MEKTKDDGPDFIGPYQVFGLQREDLITPSGNEIVKVLFENAPPKIMSMKAYKMFVSKNPIDFTTFEDKKFDLLRDDIVSLLMEYDVTHLQLNAFIDKILMPHISAIFTKAAILSITDKTYTVPRLKEWVPGTTDYSQYVTLLECDTAVRKMINNANANQTKLAEPKDGDK